jgi:phosphoribosyl 1,2-cyclic phosphodiesterase
MNKDKFIDFKYRTEARIGDNVFAHDLESLASEHDIELNKIKNILSDLFPVEYSRLNRE